MASTALTKFVITTTTCVLVGGAVASGIYFLSPSPTSTSGEGKASKPRLVIAKIGKTDSELSFNYDSFFSKGVNKTVTFDESKISFNGYQLKKGDILCSPNQNGKFFVLNEIDGRNRATSTYKIMGYPENYTATGCGWNRFSTQIKNDESKTIYLKEFAGQRNLGYGVSAGISSIYISNCSFELKEKNNQFSSDEKWGIDWKNCKRNEHGKNYWDSIPTTQLGVNYEIK